jgi:peptidoglycan-associated lipoprotein
MRKRNLILTFLVAVLVSFSGSVARAQDQLPADDGLMSYHTAPRYRESESHPLRLIGYALHPVGWVLREVFFRPLSYFASSTEVTRSVMGYREPFDYRQPECFSADDSIPDCRSLSPYNYDQSAVEATGVGEAPAMGGVPGTDTASVAGDVRQVYFPNVNFDFNSRKLNDLGKGKSKQIAAMLDKEPGVHVVLQGHTDYIGTEEYNMKLGMDRAETVRQELVSLGVTPERLSTVSFGKAQPLFAEQEDWARALNRRVEVHPNEEVAAVESGK